jgi:hypothetical protein
VQGEFEVIVPFEDLQKGEVTLSISLLQNVPKVSDGLVIVKGKNETNPVHVGDFLAERKNVTG